MIITHTDEFFCLIICFRWNMYRTVIVLCQGSGNDLRISFVCFDPSFASLFPEGIDEGSDRCEYLIETDRPLLYPHFVLWHKRMMLDTVRCDAPHEGYPTAGALLCDRYAERTVRRRGGELAARENRDGVLLGVGGEPLLIVSGRQALTTPLSAGATDSAMRRLVLSACREEGLTVTEYPLTRQMLLRCDEALTVDVQGIVPVLGYRDRRYFNTAAVRLSERINRTDIRTYR